jgi:hypothetical protein
MKGKKCYSHDIEIPNIADEFKGRSQQMPDFNELMKRHGEHGVMFFIEQIEKVEGIKGRHTFDLESRWEALKKAAANDQTFVPL